MVGARLPPDEPREENDSPDQRGEDQRVTPAAPWLLDQGEDRPREPEGAENRSDEVDLRPHSGWLALRHGVGDQ